MNATANSIPVPLAFVVLLVIHTAISLGAYRWMSKPTVIWEKSDKSTVETTIPEQEALGEKSFIIHKKTELFSAVPIPVLCYVYAGYAGLCLAAIIGFVAWIRQGPS